jgi:hypothetical protein
MLCGFDPKSTAHGLAGLTGYNPQRMDWLTFQRQSIATLDQQALQDQAICKAGLSFLKFCSVKWSNVYPALAQAR